MDYLVDFEALSWETPMPGVREKRCRRDGRVVRLVEYSAAMAPHWCEKGHIGQIIDGVLELEFSSHVVTAKTGDTLLIPPGPAHAHRAVVRTASVTALFVEEDS
jgi:ethanolamine utilization protein EutQ (cupin superfamily)